MFILWRTISNGFRWYFVIFCRKFYRNCRKLIFKKKFLCIRCSWPLLKNGPQNSSWPHLKLVINGRKHEGMKLLIHNTWYCSNMLIVFASRNLEVIPTQNTKMVNWKVLQWTSTTYKNHHLNSMLSSLFTLSSASPCLVCSCPPLIFYV